MSNDHKDFILKNGVKYWSVTTCLGVINKPEFNNLRGFKGNEEADRIMEVAAGHGKYLHSKANDILKGNGFYIPKEDIDPVRQLLINKFSAWCLFEVKKMKFYEKRFFSEKYNYCGRIDGLYLLKGKKGFDLCDIKPKPTNKTSKRLIAWQMSAYKNMLDENGVECNDRIVIEYTKDDKPIKHYRIESDHGKDLMCFLYAKHNYLDINTK